MKQVWNWNGESALKTEPVTGWRMSHHQSSLISRTQAKWKLGKSCLLRALHMSEASFWAEIHFLSKGVRLHLSSTRNPGSLSPLKISKNYNISDILNMSYVPFPVSEKLHTSCTELCICHDCIIKYYVRWILQITAAAIYAWQKPDMNRLSRALKL